jgi:hypothetical protein
MLHNAHEKRPSKQVYKQKLTDKWQRMQESKLITTAVLDLHLNIAPTQPFRAALGAESRVCYPGNTADRQTQ